MSTYCTREDVENIFGRSNVSKWADLDNDKDATKITATIDYAIQQASNNVDVALRDSVYEVPFGGAPDSKIVDIAARGAGVMIYTNRGVTDKSQSRNQLATHQEMIKEDLRRIVAGQLKLDPTTATQRTTRPSVNDTF